MKKDRVSCFMLNNLDHCVEGMDQYNGCEYRHRCQFHTVSLLFIKQINFKVSPFNATQFAT